MINTSLKNNFNKNIPTFYTHPRPTPKPLSYSNHQILTTPSPTYDPYFYVTPHIRYTTFKKDFSYKLQIETPRNTIQIDGFTSDIKDILLFAPTINTFEDKNPCMLLVLENQLIIYSMSFVDYKLVLHPTGMSVVIPNDIISVSINSKGNIIFCSKQDAYLFYYNSGLLCRTYAYNLRGMVKQLLGVIYTPKQNFIDVCISDSYAVVLKDKHFDLYRVVNSNLKYIQKYEVLEGIKIQIYDDKYIFVIKKNGKRMYYTEYGFVCTLPLKDESNFYNGETIVNSDGNTTVIIRKRIENEENTENKGDKKDDGNAENKINAEKYTAHQNTLVNKPYISQVIVITQNEYAFDNTNSPRENYNTITLNENITKIKIFNNQILLHTKNNSYLANCMNLCDLIIKCKQDEMHKLVSYCKEENFLLKYLELVERNLDVSRIDFMFLKTKNYDFVYKYMCKTLIEEGIIQENMINIENNNIENNATKKNVSFTTKYYNNNFYYTEELFDSFYKTSNAKIQRCIKKLVRVQEKISRYRKEGFKTLMSDIKNVVDTLNFMKLVDDKGLKVEYNFNSLLFSMNHRRNVLSQLSSIISFEKTSEMIRNTLKGYFPVEEVHFRKGLECIKIKKRDNFYESLQDFKKGRNFEETVRLYNEDKFYIGSVTIIKECMYEIYKKSIDTRYNEDIDESSKRYKKDTTNVGNVESTNDKPTLAVSNEFAFYTDLLRKSILCQGSLKKALEDIRKDFVFIVLETYLQNLMNGIKFCDDCLCCTKSVKYKVDNLPIDIIYLENDYLQEYLEHKYKVSQNKTEYNLLWKYYVYNDEFEKAGLICIEIAKSKSLTLNERKEYLEYSYCVDRNDDVMQLKQILELQIELVNKQEDLYFLKGRMLDVNELFNVYLYPNHEYLALKLIKIIEADDNYRESKYEDLKKELFERMFNYDYLAIIENLSYIKEINNDGWVDIEIIGDILIMKIIKDSPINIVDVLKNFYYNENKIKNFLEKRLKSKDLHYELKRRVLVELKTYFEDVSDIERICYEKYGIKC
ncbi:hypothetical protein BDAP_000136 [Binucleata daphniae]